MTKPTIVCLGPSGSFSEQTLSTTLGQQAINIKLVTDLSDLLIELENHTIDYAWLPWWNSGCGFLQDRFKKEFLLSIIRANNPYKIIVDDFTPLKFSLLSLANTAISDIKTILVNPYTQEICKQFFIKHPHLKVIVKSSSSEAAREVANQKNPSIAASGNLHAAKLYNLQVLQETMVAPTEESMMQFILLAHRDIPDAVSVKGHYFITSCAIQGDKNQLLNANLDIHASRHSSLDPSISLLELNGKIEEENLKKILDKQFLCYLGCHPRFRK